MPGTAAPLADRQAVALLEERCAACHSTDRVYASVGTPEEWAAVVHRMLYHHKAKLLTHVTDQEGAELARWLAETRRPEHRGTRIGHLPTGRPL
jgi:hypothetical protein